MLRDVLLLAALALLVSPGHASAQEAPREFILQSTDGISVHAYEFRGPVEEAPYILLFHQGGSNALGEYATIAPRLVTNGYHVLAIDQRSGGGLFDGRNRTVEGLGASAESYCTPIADLEAALDYAGERSAGQKAIVWGSSYSAALVVQLADRRPADIAGVLAFSPATGEPMEGCRPEAAAGRLSVPLFAVRPGREAAIESVATQLQTLRDQGHEVHVFEPGVHGSSTLVASRVQSDVEAYWTHVLTFLDRLETR